LPHMHEGIGRYIKNVAGPLSSRLRAYGSGASRMVLGLWHSLPLHTRERIFRRILLPGIRTLLLTAALDKRDRLLQQEISLSPDILGLEDWHELETSGIAPYRWSKMLSGVVVNPTVKSGLLEMHLGYPEHLEPPRVTVEGRSSHEIALHSGWGTYLVPFATRPDRPPLLTISVELASDTHESFRDRGIMASAMRILPHELVPTHVLESRDRTARNLLANHREWQDGKVELASFPAYLRIDLETQCNIKPRCAYCSFDADKKTESETDYRFRPGVLREMGAFFEHAQTIHDCSIGEPLMSRDFLSIVELTEAYGKRFDLTTNGQLLDAKMQDALLGKNMIVHVSLEASSADLYAQYRDDGFDAVIANVASLCRKKRSCGNLPKLIVSHIAMRSNVAHYEEFVSLMTHVGADAINIRTLAIDGGGFLGDRASNHGTGFQYEKEVLELDELDEFVANARLCTERRGLEFFTLLDFGRFPQELEPVPLCDEPWTMFYFLKRGVIPCCFGRRALFTPGQQGKLPLEEFLRQVWNSDQFREIRSYLARGQLSPYCRDTPSCPIVRRKITGR
jgi:MoaA/NifB/PqqE/SkfB family radical SAM enzyme